ncbi:hypothetical protein QAD02_014032 [Eretmocerus hayati]|uniref:Uncharacterized protein n=1 Tax=Eretmocerus hayati TaxID=131215 RepID=A0ACC2P4D5_9HYME|nr:hypothetical protein QAD02_014032 [Eretmocerus hayati]
MQLRRWMLAPATVRYAIQTSVCPELLLALRHSRSNMSSDNNLASRDSFPVLDSVLDTDAIISSAIAEFNEMVQYPELTSRLAGESLCLVFFWREYFRGSNAVGATHRRFASGAK